MNNISIFGDDGVTQIPFTGCMNPERINNIIVRQSNVVTARNVKNGCPKQVREKLCTLPGTFLLTLPLRLNFFKFSYMNFHIGRNCHL